MVGARRDGCTSGGAPLTSDRAVCVWIPLFALRAEERRRPELRGKPTALLSAEDTRRLWQVSSRAHHDGVKHGMTVSQSIGLCSALTLVEADPVHYDELFSRLLQALSDVSPVVEPGKLGCVYVGVDGLDGLIGEPNKVLAVIDAVVREVWYGELKRRWGVGRPKTVEDGRRRSRTDRRADGQAGSWAGGQTGRREDGQRRSKTIEDDRGRSTTDRSPRPSGRAGEGSGTVGLGGEVEGNRRAGGGAGRDRRVVWKLGWAKGKFPAWVAATRAKPGEPVVVSENGLAEFLSAQRIGALPLERDTHRRLWQLGLRKLSDLVALPEQAVTSQFGREGRMAWRLAAGMVSEPVIGKESPQPIRASMHFPTPIADRGILTNTIGKLTEQALRHPQRIGWRVRSVRVRAALEHDRSWMIDATLKDPSADRKHIMAPLIVKLDQTPPTGTVEHLMVEFTAFTRGTKELQLFARDAAAVARSGRQRALRWAAHEIRTRLQRPLLHHIIEVHPWSRIPERRYALIDYNP